MAKLTTKIRDKLPSWAFALPKTRAYPLYTINSKGKVVPSPSHASNAKARATQHASPDEKAKIDAKANRILYGSSKDPNTASSTKKKKKDDGVTAYLKKQY